MQARQSHIKMMAFKDTWPSASIAYVALFDERDLSEKEVRAIIDDGNYDRRVVVLTEDQYRQVFRSLIAEDSSR